MNCLFCSIVDGTIPSYKIYEDDFVYAFLDINPLSPGHTLVIPKKHTLDLFSIDDDSINVMNSTKLIAGRIMELLSPNGIRIVQNNGVLQEIKHFHIHIIPSYDNFECSIESVFNIIKNPIV